MGKKPEVNLEVSSGFFRITAEDAIYNITVLGGSIAKMAPAAENSRPEGMAAAKAAEDIQESRQNGGGQDDDYYRQVSNDLYRDIGQLAKSLSSTMMHIPMEDRRLKRVELDEAGEKIEDAKNQLKDIVEMTENATMEIMDCVERIQGQTGDVQELLALLKNHQAFHVSEREEGEASAGNSDQAAKIGEQLGQAMEIVARLRQQQAAPLPLAVSEEGGQAAEARYLFSLDTIFQTLYEFCTNETVKGHISKVREETESYLDREAVLDSLNRLVAPMEPDADNFFLLPLADLLGALEQACTDSKIKNLFKRMESTRDTIFLDQSLPLEVPAMDLAAVAAGVELAEPVIGGGENDSELAELERLLEASLMNLAELPTGADGAAPGMSTMSMADQTEIFAKIEAAFGLANHISGDVQKITESLSFQDLSGQQIMKIIKLLSDFQVQLLALVVSFGSQLKQKERNADITREESKRLAQEEVDSYINKISGADEEEGAGVLDQSSVNQILADMGF